MNEPDRPRRRAWVLYLLPSLLLLALASVAVYRGAGGGSPRFHGTAYVPPEPVADFALTDHRGETLRLDDLRGTPLLVFFGYTHCPGVCPLTLATLRRTLDSLDAGPGRVRVLLVTVDPERDTPDVLARYVARYGPGVIGATGSPEALRGVHASFGVHASPGAAGHEGHAAPPVMHTSSVFGVDREGRIRVLLSPQAPPAELAADVETLLEL